MHLVLWASLLGCLPGRNRMHHVTMMATMPAKKMKTPHFMLHSMVTKHCPITKVKSCIAPIACQQEISKEACGETGPSGRKRTVEARSWAC